MKRIDKSSLNEPNTCIEDFAVSLFFKFVASLNHKFLIFRKVIPFAYVNFFLSHYRISKKDGKKIIKIWVQRGLCTLCKYHGIKVSENISFDIIYKKAEEDTNYWLTNAPHCLNKDSFQTSKEVEK